jgi:predicted RNA-binding Zn-ribbon protein involved in translation (DUF1610 family)
MTAKEALKQIWRDTYPKACETWSVDILTKHWRVVEQALDELEKLKERDTVMKVTQTWEEEDNRVFDCPHCGDTWFYSGDSECWKFCPNCGQRLDWSEKYE